MLKRIQETFTLAEVEELNKGEFAMPTQDERENPGKTWD